MIRTKRLHLTRPITSSIQRACQIAGVLALILVASALVGCSKRYSDLPAFSPVSLTDYENKSVGRFKSSFLVEQIDHYYRGTNPGMIGITTFVNADDLYTTSTFGRMYSEQVMSELAMRGFDVVELRHADALQFLATTGEFGLSRDIAMVRRERDLGGIVVGTYVVSPERVYVNARLVDPATSVVVSAASVEMSKTQEITKMLRGGAFPGTLERIPVRHLSVGTYPMYGPPSFYPSFRVDPEEARPMAPRFAVPKMEASKHGQHKHSLQPQVPAERSR